MRQLFYLLFFFLSISMEAKPKAIVFDFGGVLVAERLRPIPGMWEWVQKLKEEGYQVALLSNVGPFQAAFLRATGYYAPFDPCILSCEIGVKKPQEEAYRILLEKLCLLPSECLFIDDQLKNVEAARAVGIPAIHFQSFEQFEKELFEFLK